MQVFLRCFADNIKEDDFQEVLNDLFEFIIYQLLNVLYKMHESDLQLTSYSNFFKTDPRYQKIILKGIEDIFYNSKYSAKRIREDYYKIFDL